jgi:hypothetical protein
VPFDVSVGSVDTSNLIVCGQFIRNIFPKGHQKARFFNHPDISNPPL